MRIKHRKIARLSTCSVHSVTPWQFQLLDLGSPFERKNRRSYVLSLSLSACLRLRVSKDSRDRWSWLKNVQTLEHREADAFLNNQHGKGKALVTVFTDRVLSLRLFACYHHSLAQNCPPAMSHR